MRSKNTETIISVVTKESFQEALRKLGVTAGMTIEVHASLSSFSYVAGGAKAINDGLIELMEDTGTLLMPMQYSENSDPSKWCNPPALPSQWQTIREHTLPYHPELTDMSAMGMIAENFRHRNGVVFSGHPAVSYAALGKYARLICNRQSMHFPLAEESPTARLYELRGYVLMIGTDYDTCTCMHLGEYRTDCRPIEVCQAVIEKDGKRRWKSYLDLCLDSEDFRKIGALMEQRNLVRSVELGGCLIRFFSAVDAVDMAMTYFEKTEIYDLYR